MAKTVELDAGEVREALVTCARAAERWARHTLSDDHSGVGEALRGLAAARRQVAALFDRAGRRPPADSERALVERMLSPTSCWLPGTDDRPILWAVDDRGTVRLSDYGREVVEGGGYLTP